MKEIFVKYGYDLE